MTRRPPPGRLVAEAVDVHGLARVHDWCERLVLGSASAGDADDPDIGLLGGAVGWAPYWGRVWGMRAFRYLPAPSRAVLEHAVRDPAWRVREHAFAVVGRVEEADLLPAAAAALDDAVPRVRAAALRVVTAMGEVEDADRLRRMPLPPGGQDAVDGALARMTIRLDRPV